MTPAGGLIKCGDGVDDEEFDWAFMDDEDDVELAEEAVVGGGDGVAADLKLLVLLL